MLALETSAAACSVALQIGEKIISRTIVEPRKQTQQILPMIYDLLLTANVTQEALQAVAFSQGPGSFTGVRVASSVAQGLGFALQIPIIAVSSLAVLAQTVWMQSPPWQQIVTLVDAHMGQVYCGIYQLNANGIMELIAQEGVYHPKEIQDILMDLPEDRHWYGAGDGWVKYGEILNKHLRFSLQAINPYQPPLAEALLCLAHEKVKHNGLLPASKALPVYFR